MVRILEKQTTSSESLSSNRRNSGHRVRTRDKQNMPPAICIVSSSVVFALGFVLAFLPFKNDLNFRFANDKRDLVKLTESALSLSTNSYLVNSAQEIAIKSNSGDLALKISDFAVSRFPRNIYAWQARSVLTSVSEQERASARARFLELDPNFALCLGSDPIGTISGKLKALPSAKQYELATWWGMASSSDRSRNFSFSTLPNEKLAEQIRRICG